MASIALLSPIRLGLHEAPTAAERSALAEHFRFLQRLVAEGRVLTAGPCEDGSLGLVVFPNADAATASALMATDPAVVAGVFRVEVKAWRRSLLGHGSGRDWTGFVQAVHIQASPGEAWSMFATPSGIERWFTASAETTRGDRVIGGSEVFQPADRVRFVWIVPSPETAPAGGSGSPSEAETNGAPATVEMPETNEILEVVPGRRLRHGWYEGKGWVEYRVLPHREERRVTIELEQRMDPAHDFALLEGAYVGCRQGWAFYLANLKAVLEHGLDLREPRPDRRDLINV